MILEKYEALSLHFFWTLKPTKSTKKYQNFNTNGRYKSCLLFKNIEIVPHYRINNIKVE